MIKYFLATNDVEFTSLRYNKQRKEVGDLIQNEGLPLLLDLYRTFKIKATFFVTADIAQTHPQIARLIIDNGHELASHSYSHEDQFALDQLEFCKQKELLEKAKKTLEDISGKEVISFRAPALRVNEFTPKALKAAGYNIDSSISPQRADMFFSFGALRKINRLLASRKPGYVKPNDLTKRGNFPVFEIPISALILPYIGTTLRISPFIIRYLRNILDFETSYRGNPINFLIHPNELIKESNDDFVHRRSNNPISYLFAEKIRRRLKLTNLGLNALYLYAEHLTYFVKKNYHFVTCKEHYESWLEN
jgi:peptidoglycan/xylan/chitin deacetylase (PgdA/CDA1 family)